MSSAWRERLRVRAARYGATPVPGPEVSFAGGARAGLPRINASPFAWPGYELPRPRAVTPLVGTYGG
jgi:hypothetical protein